MMGQVRRFEIDLELALEMCSAARAEATDLGVLMSIAIVDAGGHLICFQRMDGAEIAGPVLARDKAYTAVAHRIDTASLTTLAAPGGELAGLYAADQGRYITFAGGIPLWDGPRVIGGAGASGGSAVQDAKIAAAAGVVYERAIRGH